MDCGLFAPFGFSAQNRVFASLLLMRWRFAAQQPQTTCTEAVSSDCQKFEIIFFREILPPGSLNLQFSLQGQMHKSKLCLSSFKKPVVLLTQSLTTDCGTAIEHLHTIQCLISLLLHKSSKECSTLLQMASSSTCLLQPISSLLSCFHNGNNLISAEMDPSALLSYSVTICWISLIKWLVPYQNSQLVTTKWKSNS